MEVGKLTAKRRYQTGKSISRKLRVAGRLPGVCYGKGMETPIAIDFDVRSFRGSLDPAKRRNTLIDLVIDGGDQGPETRSVMVKEYQIHPIRRDLMHVDFVVVDREQEIEVDVPIEFVGKAKGLAVGGVLNVVRRRLELSCKASQIPTHITVDVTDLDANDVIHVSDLTMPEGASAVTPAQLTVITCSAPVVDDDEDEEEAAAES